MSDTAVLVACGNKKREGTFPAYSIYDSTLFQKSWMAATYNGDPYVMSAKHNLLSGDQRIEEYDETLKGKSKQEKREWASKTISQLPNHYDTVVLLGGRDYVDPIIDVCSEYEFIDPYQYTSGNGQQMKVADRLTRAGYNGGTVKQAVEYAVDPYK